jgi:hypothetical protein
VDLDFSDVFDEAIIERTALRVAVTRNDVSRMRDPTRISDIFQNEQRSSVL